MRTSSGRLALVLRLAMSAPLVPCLVAVATSTLVACDDENEPKTWVKRLDDPAQRAPARSSASRSSSKTT